MIFSWLVSQELFLLNSKLASFAFIYILHSSNFFSKSLTFVSLQILVFAFLFLCNPKRTPTSHFPFSFLFSFCFPKTEKSFIAFQEKKYWNICRERGDRGVEEVSTEIKNQRRKKRSIEQARLCSQSAVRSTSGGGRSTGVHDVHMVSPVDRPVDRGREQSTGLVDRLTRP